MLIKKMRDLLIELIDYNNNIPIPPTVVEWSEEEEWLVIRPATQQEAVDENTNNTAD